MTLPALLTQWLGALLTGLAASLHCFGMCGGLQAALAPGTRGAGLWRLQLGRSLAYLAVGALAGGLAGRLGTATALGLQAMPDIVAGTSPPPSAVFLRWVALLLASLALLGLAWRLLGRGDLFGLERLGTRLWQALQPLGRWAGEWREPWRSLGLGFVWAFIPCALVLSMAALAATTGSAWQGAALMGAFALGTWPAMLGAAAMGQGLARWGAGAPHWLRGLVVAGLVLLAATQWSFLTTAHHVHEPAGLPVDAAATSLPMPPSTPSSTPPAATHEHHHHP